MRPRALISAGVLCAVVLVLGGLLIGRLLPSSGSDGRIEPVIISPAGLTVPDSTATSPASPPGATPTPTQTTATKAPPPKTTPTVTPAPPKPSQIKPKPKPVDDDDDDDDDDDRDDDDDDDDDD